MSHLRNGINILLVEDDDIDARAILRGLRKLNLKHKIMRGKNGIEALEILRAEQCLEQPYIILLDLNMPLMGGLEFLNEIRKDAQLSASIIFVLTTSNSEGDLASAYQDGVSGYFVKSEFKESYEPMLKFNHSYWRDVVLSQYQ